MLRQKITVQPLQETDIPHIIELMQEQARRLDELDPRLQSSRSRTEMEKMLQAQLHMKEHRPLVAHSAEGDIRGYTLPMLWEMQPDEEMVAFFSTRNGSCQYWTLPSPTENDALPVAEALLDALTDYWQQQHTYHDVLRWPSNDLWLEKQILARGFLTDNQMALRNLEPLPASKHAIGPDYHARLAQPADEEALVKLYREEIDFHLAYTPFVRIVPGLETALRERLKQVWMGISVLDGAPLLVVIEHQHKLVAMAENELLIVPDSGGYGLMPPGRYGYLNNVSVSEKIRDLGIGHMLVAEVFKAFQPLQINAYLLWYSQDNPRASYFWPHMGFRPLWKTYQRINGDDGVRPIH